jgi:hypothetical protein
VLARRFAVNLTDPQLLANDSHLLQAAEDIPGHALGQVDEGVIVADVHVADVTSFQACLVGDSADDVARLYAVRVPHLEPECLEVHVILFPAPPPLPRATLSLAGPIPSKLRDAIALTRPILPVLAHATLVTCVA